MPRYGMVIDTNKCTGCFNCFLACRDEFAGNEYPGYSAAQPMEGQNWIRVFEKERGSYPKVKVHYTPVLCMHCMDAGCIKTAQNNAIYRKDGIVIIDPVKSKGQKQIVTSCPYRIIEWNNEKQIPQKCNMCAHLLDKGETEPRCVESCPTDALVFGDLDDPASNVSRLLAAGKAESLHPEFMLKENVKYFGLPRKFIAGTIIYGDKDVCAGGLAVTVEGNGSTAVTKTNNFGDFEFEDLEDNINYIVKIVASGYKSQEIQTRTSADVYLGEIVLKP